jgi:hypothetical protein
MNEVHVTPETDIKDLVKDRDVLFEYYRDQTLWYIVKGTDFIFPVPCSDIGTATFRRTDKAILFMRYIRKQLELLKEAKTAGV